VADKPCFVELMPVPSGTDRVDLGHWRASYQALTFPPQVSAMCIACAVTTSREETVSASHKILNLFIIW
jgi:hypothetical protein